MTSSTADDLIAAMRQRPHTLAEIAAALDRSEKTAHRWLTSLRRSHSVSESVRKHGAKAYQIVGRTKGHWPRGRRRNPDSGAWAGTRLALRALLAAHHQRGVVSVQRMAVEIGVHPRSAYRWLAGEDRPPVEKQELVASWVQAQRERIKREQSRT